MGRGDAIPNDFVVPYDPSDLKRRISVARVADRLYAFDDLCTCADAAMPALRRTADRDDAHVPMPRLPVRTSATGAVINGPATKALHVYEVQELDGSVQIRA